MKTGTYRYLLLGHVLWIMAGCFNPNIPEGVACGIGGECPADQTCDQVDNRCYSVLPDRDGGSEPVSDGSTQPVPDAAAPVMFDGGGEPDAGSTTPSCDNDTKDGDETDVDCGGATCPACDTGQECAAAGDCISGVCGGDMRCAAPECGDGVVNQATEVCDDGPANSDTTSDACRTNCQPAACGDGVLDTGEDADPPSSPSTSVPIDVATCRYDITGIRQLSCNGVCGNWNGLDGCQKEDADVLCKLVTGNPNSTVVDPDSSFNVESALAAPGICCPPPTAEPGTQGCVFLGNMSQRGVDVEVSVHDTDLSDTHGTGAVVTIQSVDDCTNP